MKYVQAWWGDLDSRSELQKRCMGTVEAIAGSEYDLRVFGAVDKPQSASDSYRYHMAQTEPDACWIDCDIELYHPLNFDRPTVDYRHGWPHGAILYVGGACEFFQGLEADRVKRGIEKTAIGFHTKLLRKHLEYLGQVPDSWFKHYFTTTLRGQYDV